ncbi:sensor histidine kinase [Cohnella ginsengisoli]
MTVCLVFGILFALLQNRSVIRPLKQLHREMSKVKNGSFHIGLDIRTGDEIGRVAFIFTGMVQQIQDLIERVYKGQLREKEAELKAMQAQINPHFLYNTLDSIRWMAVKNKDYEVGEQIEALSDLFRHSLNQGKEATTLREEIDHLRNYLLIQQTRFSDRLSCLIEVDPSALDAEIPKLVLQPLVENAIVHGLEDEPRGGRIEVRAAYANGEIAITVRDNGKGTDALPIRAMLAGDTTGREAFALLNIHERIKLRYGEEYGLEFDSAPGRGTVVVVRIPARETTKEER